MASRMMLSLIIPVYRNQQNLPRLLRELEAFGAAFAGPLEIVFVVDGSPDESFRILSDSLPSFPLETQLIELSRNFGSFSAITAGLKSGRGDCFAALAADLQEPLELIAEFHRVMEGGEADVVFGYRAGRSDPWLSQFLSGCFWNLYRRFVIPDIPKGGIDIFGCTRQVRDELLQLRESQTNLIALLFWLGFRRRFIPYERRARQEGRSAWTFGKKLRYAADSIFSFTDLPLRALMIVGAGSCAVSVAASVAVLTAWSFGSIPVLGYTPLMLAISFFGGSTALGLGIVGQYVWLALRNARQRPGFIVRSGLTHRATAARVASK